MSYLILGVDPAMSGPAGIALVDAEADSPVLALDVLQYPKEPPEHRYQRLHAFVSTKCSQWSAALAPGEVINLIACESAYMDKNAATTIALAQCAGMVRALAYSRGLPFVATNPLHTRTTLEHYPGVLFQPALKVAGISARHKEHALCAAGVAFRAYQELREQALKEKL
jgi:Holliday junction resolvasome RuvABC endonuclease subunit